MLLSNWAARSQNKLTFIKNQKLHNFDNISNDQFKMNKIINKFSLTDDKFAF